MAVGCGAFAVRAADTPSSLVVLVVDARRVMIDSKAGKAIQMQMQQQFASYQKNISQQEQELVSAQQELQRQQTILSQDAFAAKAKEFDQRIADARRKAQEAQGELARAEGQAQDKERLALQEILASIAKEHSANIILDKSTVLLFDSHFEITDEVMKRLDEKLPNVTVVFSSPGTPVPAAQPPAKAATPPKKKG
jgi:Skp family chaperone for outer membrane proteins